jgi:signal transduction histidine kinase
MEKSRFSWRGVIPQLLAIVVLPLAGLALLIAFSSMRLHQQAMRALVGERDQRAVRAAASALGEQLNHRAAAIQGLAVRVSQVDSPSEAEDILRDHEFLLPDFDGGMAIISREQELLAYAGDPALWKNLDPAIKEALGLLAGQTTQPTPQGSRDVAFLPAPHQRLTFVAALAPDQRVVAVGAFSPASLAEQTLASLIDPGEGAVAFGVDTNGQLLFRIGTTTGDEDLTSHSGVSEALLGNSGATFVQDGGSEHVVAYSPVPLVGWALVIDEPWEALTSPLLRTTEDLPWMLIPVLILALVAIWYGTRWIVQPLQRLEARAAELAWGDFGAIEEPVGGIAEIRRLQSELAHLAHKVKAAQEGLRDYIGAITTGQEEERRRLARELHDDTLQSLIALNQRVQLAGMSLDGAGEAGSLAEIQRLIDETIQNLRRLTRALRPIYLEDLGLAAALEMLSREIEQGSELKINFVKTGSECRLQPTEELALFRVAQEALNNVIRHAQATQAEIRLSFTPDAVALEVRDNGQGFEVPESPAEFAPGGHFGLLGLHERADLIEARLEIYSAPGEGTRVLVTLPVSTPSNEIGETLAR